MASGRIKIYQGKILRVGGKIATHDDCCCGKISITFSITSCSGCLDCGIEGSTYINSAVLSGPYCLTKDGPGITGTYTGTGGSFSITLHNSTDDCSSAGNTYAGAWDLEAVITSRSGGGYNVTITAEKNFSQDGDPSHNIAVVAFSGTAICLTYPGVDCVVNNDYVACDCTIIELIYDDSDHTIMHSGTATMSDGC